MRKLLLALVLVLSIGANAQYRYKNIEVTATSKDGEVKTNKSSFSLTSDSIDYTIEMDRYDVLFIDIYNRSSELIIVKLKGVYVSSDNGVFYKANPYGPGIDDPRTGEQKIYPNGYNMFSFSGGGMLSKKKNTTAHVTVTFIRNNREEKVTVYFNSHPIK